MVSILLRGQEEIDLFLLPMWDVVGADSSAIVLD